MCYSSNERNRGGSRERLVEAADHSGAMTLVEDRGQAGKLGGAVLNCSAALRKLCSRGGVLGQSCVSEEQCLPGRVCLNPAHPLSQWRKLF